MLASPATPGNAAYPCLPGRGEGIAREPIAPVASVVPNRITPQANSMVGVTRSSSTQPPHSTAKAGIRKVTAIAFAGPKRAMRRKYSRYATAVQASAS